MSEEFKKQIRFPPRRLPHSQDLGEYDNYEEITDVASLITRLEGIERHVRISWDANETRNALGELRDARVALIAFQELANKHREKVLSE